MSTVNILEMEEEEPHGDCLDFTFTRPSFGSEPEYDDELDLPNTLKVIDVDGKPVAIEHSDDENNDVIVGANPFGVIHGPPVKFSSLHRHVFIPGVEITANITDYERHLTTHLLNPNLYTITLVHGEFTWSVKKRYKQIQNLHQQLTVFRASLNIPFPTKTHRKKRESLKANSPKKGKRRGLLPRFPKKPEVLVPFEKLDVRIKQLEAYLNNLLAINIYRNHPATIEFLEVSHVSFVRSLGVKRKEGMVKKKTGSTEPGQSGCNCFGLFRSKFCVRYRHFCNNLLCSRWVDRWFFIKDNCFGYMNPKDGVINCVVLFDQGFEVASGFYTMNFKKGVHVLSLTRQLSFECWTKRKAKEWIEALKETAAGSARDFTQPNRHHSFAPQRTNVKASWFVDGASYMEAVAEAIDKAKEEVFIADWWLSPEIYMKRPVMDGDYWRLDKLLQRKATSGVKIFVLLYKEVEMALGLNSYYSKQRLVELSENIKVLRHPDHAKVGVFLWAHHEKIVVVDQTYAFLGGIDLCYGRWDDNQHRLTDLGSMTPAININTLKKRTSSVPLGDSIYPIPVPYHKQMIPEIIEEASGEISSEEDIQIATDNNFLQPPSPQEHMKCNTPTLDRRNVLTNIKNTVKIRSKDLLNLVYSPQEIATPETPPIDPKPETTQILYGVAKYWYGKDYVNFIVKDFSNLDAPYDDFIDRVTTPRMPWHDVGVCVQGSSARDVARHFIQRWNATKLEKARKNKSYPYLLPKGYEDFGSLPLLLNSEVNKVTCQVLRSVSTWSCGFLEPDTVEESIHEAYIDAIMTSQHFIYIENQFFISLPYSNPNTRNQIGEALYKRILRAHRSQEIFRVYVVMPLLPGFEGEVGGPTGTSLHAVTHWNYSSISRGKDAILNRLKEAGIDDPSEYISFYGLRTHSTLNGEPITELVYVHSKLMIVDDKVAICGSANLNDRSMIGKRDSEIAVRIEDESFEDGVMNGEPFPSGRFVGGLRRHLFKEHLGLLIENAREDIDVSDPICGAFYREIWHKTAVQNTESFEKVFHCIPSDLVESFVDLKKRQQEKPLYAEEPNQAENMLENIQGNVVLLPLNFLCKEILTPAVNSMEGILPTALWT